MLVLTNLNLNKNEIQNAVIQPLSSPPESPVLGQIYFDTTDNMLKYGMVVNGLTLKILILNGIILQISRQVW